MHNINTSHTVSMSIQSLMSILQGPGPRRVIFGSKENSEWMAKADDSQLQMQIVQAGSSFTAPYCGRSLVTCAPNPTLLLVRNLGNGGVG